MTGDLILTPDQVNFMDARIEHLVGMLEAAQKHIAELERELAFYRPMVVVNG